LRGTLPFASLCTRFPPSSLQVAAWGPRPAEGSPFDQLLLQTPDEDFMLDHTEVFELFARHKADPAYWTAERLAAKYETSECRRGAARAPRSRHLPPGALHHRHATPPPSRLHNAPVAETAWVEVLLEYVSPPVYCHVDGEPYGVYAIRPTTDLEAPETSSR
jgi:hypothetical protein